MDAAACGNGPCCCFLFLGCFLGRLGVILIMGAPQGGAVTVGLACHVPRLLKFVVAFQLADLEPFFINAPQVRAAAGSKDTELGVKMHARHHAGRVPIACK
jgi:hypothetical protein